MIKQMNINEIKQISINQYLSDRNILPARDYGYYGMYRCPFRDDRNASFKVDFRQNLWADFGTGEGGSIIDLVMKMNGCTFNEAVSQLEGNTDNCTNDCTYKHYNVATLQHSNADDFSFHRNQIIDVKPITHPKLIAYITERKISLDLANLYCREIHYQNRAGKFFSIGFPNDKGGYELSNKPNFKGCIAPKDITTVRNNADACLVFEGFWDFLSYLAIQKIDRTRHDVAVLNSVSNVQKSLEFLKTHKAIYTYLDNDEGGRNATKLIKSTLSTVYNCSTQFAGYKDLNDYLTGKKQVIEVKKKKGFRL
jgi:hypothetical protein